MKAKGAVAAVAAAMLAMGAVVVAPPALADGCGNAVVWGNGGGQCDGPYYPDGSFQRCVSVYVLGIGGSNCFIVPPHLRRRARDYADAVTRSRAVAFSS